MREKIINKQANQKNTTHLIIAREEHTLNYLGVENLIFLRMYNIY